MGKAKRRVVGRVRDPEGGIGLEERWERDVEGSGYYRAYLFRNLIFKLD